MDRGLERTAGRVAIESAGKAGLDLLEIPLLRPQEFDVVLTKQQLADNGISAACSLALPGLCTCRPP